MGALKVTEFDPVALLDGSEIVGLAKGGSNYRTTVGEIAAMGAVSAHADAVAASTSETNAAASATLAQGYAAQPKYGGKINAWPDPFFRHSSIGVNFLGRVRWVTQTTDYSSLSYVANPLYDGNALSKTVPGATAQCGPLIRLDEIGLGGAAPGDTITLSILVQNGAVGTGRTAKCNISWYSAVGSAGGFTTGNMVNDSGGVGVVLTNSPQRLHISVVVPSSPSTPVAVALLPFSTDMIAGENFLVLAAWGYKGAVAAGPAIPDFLGDDAYFALYNSTREYTGGLEQLFDVTTVINGYQVNSTDGKIVANANSDSVVIPLPDVPAGSRLTISGLPLPSSLARTYMFYSAKPTAFDGTGTTAAKISGGTINSTLAGATITVPAGAKYLALSPRQQTVAAGDFSQVVIRAGSTAATGPVGFVKHVARVDTVPPQNTTPLPPYGGGIGLIFGDSITATNNVDAASYTYPDGFSTNWPDEVIPRLMPDAVYNFARAGARYQKNGSLVNMQQFALWDATNGWQGQVGAALAYAVVNSIVPRWVGVWLGTNDIATDIGAAGNFGSYATAMGKSLSFDGSGVPTTTLDQTLSLEAMRLGLARLSWQFPNAILFVGTPLQRGTYTVPQMQTYIDQIALMARTYGATVIDGFSESGILHDFEIASPWRDTVDGLHPNATTGRVKERKLYVPRMQTRLLAGDRS